MSDWGFSPATYLMAAESVNPDELTQLRLHLSHFVRARVAGNIHTPLQVREYLQHDEHRGVLCWLIHNKQLTHIEFNKLFEKYGRGVYDDMLHPTLAGSPLASINQLAELKTRGRWIIHITILNNHKGRNHGELCTLIKSLLPPEDIPISQWNEIQKRAYLRTFGTRFPKR